MSKKKKPVLILDINGKRMGQRYQISVGGFTVYLSGTHFKMLAVLALEAYKEKGDGWVDRKDLNSQPGNASRYMYYLREQFRLALVGTEAANWEGKILSDKKGKYKLDIPRSEITFSESKNLKKFNDWEITRRLNGRNKCL